MQTTNPKVFLNPDSSPNTFRQQLAAAARFWEFRRLFYNLLLAGVCVVWVISTWPAFKPAFTFLSLVQLSALALIANLCYSAVYLVEIPMQAHNANSITRRIRWTLWIAGTLFAIVLTNYWIVDEIYPTVR